MEGSRENAKPTAIAVASWSGPLPSPDALQAYERCVAGAAERILAMAEREAKVRHELLMKDAKDIDARIRRGQFLGAFCALSFLVGTVVCAWLGATAAAVALAGATIVGLVNALINPKRR